jgi:hypothetical protein
MWVKDEVVAHPERVEPVSLGSASAVKQVVTGRVLTKVWQEQTVSSHWISHMDIPSIASHADASSGIELAS